MPINKNVVECACLSNNLLYEPCQVSCVFCDKANLAFTLKQPWNGLFSNTTSLTRPSMSCIKLVFFLNMWVLHLRACQTEFYSMKNIRKVCSSLNKVLSDERLGAKLRVTENWRVLFNSLTYVYLALLPQHWALHAKVDSNPTFMYKILYKDLIWLEAKL